MMGLPGSTHGVVPERPAEVHRPRRAAGNPTELLANSPMNEPGYRESTESRRRRRSVHSHQRAETRTAPRSVRSSSQLRASPGPTTTRCSTCVVCSSSLDNFGVLRQVSRFVRQELRLPEIELYERLRLDARARPDLWPALAFTFRVVPFLGTACL